MLRPRVIPCLLMKDDEGLTKTQKFKNGKYVGDPINAVKIFNEKEADELMILDIDATRLKYEPKFDLISKISAECRMPLCYGGGIKTAKQAVKLIDMGVEKVAISSAAIMNPSLIEEISSAVGSQSVVVVLDVKKKTGLFSSGYEVFTHNGSKKSGHNPEDLIIELQETGVGEIVINSIDNDGEMSGYDIELAKKIKNIVKVPMTMLGGAGSHKHIKELYTSTGLIGAAAGSLFVFKGKYKAVLINYPNKEEKLKICQNAHNIKYTRSD